MTDFFEIDLLDVESKKSGDAITIRYSVGGNDYIHVVDSGYPSTGESVVSHIRKYYGNPSFIDNVVVTHQDTDHAGGVRSVLEAFEVGCLWMHRPWLYASEIIHRFKRFTNVDNLSKELRLNFPNLALLEDIAVERGIEIREPFQGSQIGAFTVLAPSKERFLDLVVESEKTPPIIEEAAKAADALRDIWGELVIRALQLVHADWGVEKFSTESTSTENRMSVVQYANLCGKRILLTGDVDVEGLNEAADFAPFVGLALPGIQRFQVPHHGSRRNVSTEVLDRWLGPILPEQLPTGSETFTAMISSAKEDPHHPRNAVLRAMMHRGGRILMTEGQSKRTQQNAPERAGWTAVEPVPYPSTQEE